MACQFPNPFISLDQKYRIDYVRKLRQATNTAFQNVDILRAAALLWDISYDIACSSMMRDDPSAGNLCNICDNKAYTSSEQNPSQNCMSISNVRGRKRAKWGTQTSYVFCDYETHKAQAVISFQQPEGVRVTVKNATGRENGTKFITLVRVYTRPYSSSRHNDDDGAR